MNHLFLIFALLVPSSLSRPDIGLTGYRYQIPATSYGVPTGSISTLPSVNSNYYQTSGTTGTDETRAPASVLQTPIHESSSFNGLRSNIEPSGTNIQTGGVSFGGTQQEQTSSFTGLRSNIDLPSHISSGTNIQTGGISPFGGTQPEHTQQVEVEKHLYFYAAPEEPEDVQTRVNIPVQAPKKHVKIIFIKAPTYAARAPIQIPLQPQNQEKTIVYVLVKKPEAEAEISVPTAAPTKPSKPEVYFIKYKSQEEAQQAISNIQSGTVDAGAVSVNTVDGDQSKSYDYNGGYNLGVDNRLSPSVSDNAFNVIHSHEEASTSAPLGAHVEAGGQFGGSTSSVDTVEITPTTPRVHEVYGPPKTS